MDGYTSNVTITLSLSINSSVVPGVYSIPVFFSLDDVDEKNGYDGTKYSTINVIEKVQEQPQETENPTDSGQTSTSSQSEQSTVTPRQKSSDASLKSLTAQTGNKSIDVAQNSSKYSATVESNVNAVTFTVKANSSSATIDSNKSTSGLGFVKNSGSGAQKTYTVSNLKEGNNVVKITITAEDGTQRNYTFTVTKKVAENNEEIPVVPNIVEEEQPVIEENQENVEEENKTEIVFGLKSLIITGVEISPEFDVNTYEYTATIEGSDSVEVIAIATDEEAKVEIVGNTNLVSGENLITIIVKKDEELKTYQVILNKTDTETASTDASNDESLFAGLTWKHLSIIIAAVLVIIAIIAKLFFLSKTTIEDVYEEEMTEDGEDNSTKNNEVEIGGNRNSPKKGKRFK